MKKTKVMFNSLRRVWRFEVGTGVLEVVKDYIYLGQVGTADSDHEPEIARRIQMGGAHFAGTLRWRIAAYQYL